MATYGYRLSSMELWCVDNILIFIAPERCASKPAMSLSEVKVALYDSDLNPSF